MKSFFFLLSIACWTTLSQAQTKRALIVAIGNYPEKSGWHTISSDNDVPLIQSALVRQKFTNLTVLLDNQADKIGVTNALRKLVADSKPGDKVVIHFSSHGQQISDDSDDELDGYDEAIVCYGAPLRANVAPEYANYAGYQHLRDDEFNAFIEQLRTKLGASGDILVIADACHSGTISRGGLAKVRGSAEPFNLPGKAAKPININGKSQETRPFMAPQRVKSNMASELAPFVIISASKASELNYEYILPDGNNKGVGSLSYAFNKALRSVGPSETYRTLFSRIVSEMKVIAPQQTPEIDGDYDRELFGGKAVQQTRYYTLQELKDGGRQIVIPAGRLEMVNVETKVRVCPVGTTDPMQTTTFLSGKVIQAGMFQATIQLDKPLPADQQTNQWVFVTERSFGDLTVIVSTDSLRIMSLRIGVEKALHQLPLIKFSKPDASELYIAQRDSLGTHYALVRKTTDGFFIGEPIALTSDDEYEKIRERIEDYAQGKFLQSFSSDYDGIQLNMELLPLREVGGIRDTLRRADYMSNGLIRFAYHGKGISDSAAVAITNTGRMAVYFSIIDIQPDGIVNVLFPMAERPTDNGGIYRDYPSNYLIKAGERLIIPTKVGFAPPYGKEVFKVMASPEEFDLRNINNMRKRSESAIRGLSKAIEQLFGSAQVLIRGGGTGAPSNGTPIGTFNYPFRIVRAGQL